MKLRQIPVKPGDKWWFPGDIHFDQQDDAALEVSTQMMAGEGVNGICLIGDTFNSMGISRHQSLKAARHYNKGSNTLKSEKEAGKKWLPLWQKLVNGRCELMQGNHEKWWSAVQDEFPGLMDTHWTELYGDLFDGWTVSGENTGLKFGPLLAVHGHRLRGSLAKKSAFAVLHEYPSQNTLFGHTHRMEQWIGATMKNGVQEFHGAWTVGNMRDRDSELDDPYMSPHAERHRQGGALVDFYDRGQGELGFNVTLVPVERDSLDKPFMVVNGSVYRDS